MLKNTDHLKKWLDFGHGMLIYLHLVPLWISETGQVWGFRVLSGEHVEIIVKGGVEAYFRCFVPSSVQFVVVIS